MRMIPLIEPVYGKIFKIGNKAENEVSGVIIEPFKDYISKEDYYH